VVPIVVQNLVEIDAVVSIIYKLPPKFWFLEDLTPKLGAISTKTTFHIRYFPTEVTPKFKSI